jgi:phenylacetate-CoA ligase
MLNSGIPGLTWPPIPGRMDAWILALLDQFHEARNWPLDRLRDHQFKQLAPLLRHHARTSPFFTERYGAWVRETGGKLTPESFKKLPLLTRADIQNAGESLFSTEVPTDHGLIWGRGTSGSTGEPVTIRVTNLSEAFRFALSLRFEAWNNRDRDGIYALIRAIEDSEQGLPPEGDSEPNWRPFPGNRTRLLNCGSCSLDQQLDWLAEMKVNYLTTYPSNLEYLARRSEERNFELPCLRDMSTMSEGLSLGQRTLIERAFGAPVIETYGSEEVGFTAFQCPQPGHHHLLVQMESVICEILNENGEECAPGEVGRVVVTDLHNFASPLIRYEQGDLAEWDAPCAGEFTRPAIRRVMGRVRHMMQLPGGAMTFPFRWEEETGKIAPSVRQLQIIQRSLSEMDVVLAVQEPLVEEEEKAILGTIAKRLDHKFQLTPVYVDKIPRAKSGKFEEFVCAVEG